MVVFVLNGLVFILIALQLSTILTALASRSLPLLAGLGAADQPGRHPDAVCLGLRRRLPAVVARPLTRERRGATLVRDIRRELGRHARRRVAGGRRPGHARPAPALHRGSPGRQAAAGLRRLLVPLLRRGVAALCRTV